MKITARIGILFKSIGKAERTKALEAALNECRFGDIVLYYSCRVLIYQMFGGRPLREGGMEVPAPGTSESG